MDSQTFEALDGGALDSWGNRRLPSFDKDKNSVVA